MGNTADTIIPGAKLALGYAEGLAAAIPEDKASCFACTDGTNKINASHPTFNLGHLALYASKLLEVMGQDPAPAAVPANYAELFAAGVECKDDPDSTIYPPFQEVYNNYKKGYQAVIDAIPNVPEETFAAQNPNEGMRERFPTVGSLAAFLTSGHPMMHLGQISTWRRAIGLGSVF